MPEWVGKLVCAPSELVRGQVLLLLQYTVYNIISTVGYSERISIIHCKDDIIISKFSLYSRYSAVIAEINRDTVLDRVVYKHNQHTVTVFSGLVLHTVVYYLEQW